MPEHLDKSPGRRTTFARTIRAVLSASGVCTDPEDRSDAGVVAWAKPLVDAVADHIVPPPHMERDDLRQQAWVGVVQALRTHDAARGPLRHWAVRGALQRVYDALRWADLHDADIGAVEIAEVENLVEDLRANPEDLLFRQQPRARLAHHAARLVRSASHVAQAMLRARLASGNAITAEERLAVAGFTPDEVERGRQELRALGLAAMRQVISENRLVFGSRRP